MSNNVAAQQIANLLTQAGVPAGHSLDVAQRLLSMANAGPATSPGSRSIDSTAASTSDFFNKYKASEQTARDGGPGKAGKDGLPGYGGRGVDGRDGMPGIPGTPGEIDWDSIKDLIASMIQEALATFLQTLLNSVLNCTWFRKKAKDCLEAQPGGGGGFGGCPKCCKTYGMGITRNTDVCWVLFRHAWMLAQIEKRLNKIERDLANTTDCEA